MPVGDQSWAFQMDDDDDDLDGRRVEYDGDTKIVTEIRDQDGKKIQVKQYFRTEKRKVSASIGKRKTWAKFGLSANDPPGPNSQTTFFSDDVQMEFLSSKEDEMVDKDLSAMLNKSNQNVRCRTCGHNHWTLKCPFFYQLGANNYNDSSDQLDEHSRLGKPGLTLPTKPLGMTRSKEENNTIRITNLPEETQDGDIRDLFKDFGRIVRIFLAKDKNTGNSKGFAFVSFENKESAQRAIKAVNGHGYNNLILSVEWARPSN